MKSSLFVPINLDALFVPDSESVIRPMADFSVLPWREPTTQLERNAEFPYLSQSLAAAPLAGPTDALESGLHLHWALPDALTVGRHPERGGEPMRDRPLEFQAAPNRWLVVRSGGFDAEGNRLPDAEWIVESDRLTAHTEESNAIPWPLHGQDDDGAPFARLGRTLRLIPGQSWSEGDLERYLISRKGEEPLTAMGWGEPMFAVLYSNCRGVFGFHDPELAGASASQLEGLRYLVAGWYSDPAHDALTRFLEDRFSHRPDVVLLRDLGLLGDDESRLVTDDGRPLLTDEGRVAAFHIAFQEHFGWSLDAEDVAAVRANKAVEWKHGDQPALAFHAEWQYSVEPGASDRPPKAPVEQVVVAETGSNALSTWLAKALGSDAQECAQIEDQLEGLALGSELADHRLDLAAKLREARHNLSFSPSRAGTLWVLKEREVEKPAQPEHVETEEDLQYAASTAPLIDELDVELQGVLAQSLHALNQVQMAWDRANRVEADLRRRIYSDWCRYQAGVYQQPSTSRADEAPSPDQIREWIEVQVAWLQIVRAFMGDFDDATGIASWPTLDAGAISDATKERLAQYLLRRGDKLGSKAVADADKFQREFVQWYGPFLERTVRKAPKLVVDIMRHELLPASSDLRGTPLHEGELASVPLAEMLQIARNFASSAEEDIDEIVTELYRKSFLTDRLKNALTNVSHRMPRARKCAAELESRIPLSNADAGKVREIVRMMREQFVHRTFHRGPAPQFWSPNEPSLLLVGGDLEPSIRHGQDGLLPLRLSLLDLAAALEGALSGSRAGTVQKIRAICDAAADDAERYRQWSSAASAPSDSALALQEFLRDHNKTLVDEAHVIPEADATFDEYSKDIRSWSAPRARSLAAARRSDGGDPWHSLMIEWGVRLKHGGGATQPAEDGAAAAFGPESITAAYQLLDSETDLRPRSEAPPAIEVTGRIAGRSILTPHAREQLEESIDSYLDWAEEHRAEIEAGSAEDDLAGMLRRARQELDRDPTRHFQSQLLTGFHSALEMHHQAMQVPVADPLAMPADGDELPGYGAFADLVRDAVGDLNHRAPDPGFGFLPIRTGAMQLEQLVLVDSFGRTRDVDLAPEPRRGGEDRPRVQTTEDLKAFAGHEPGWIGLSPRFTQPARIDVRWLSAANGAVESNAHPLTNPVCGWLVPNNLDASLMVYAAEGHALGYVDVGGHWRLPPGQSGPITPSEISNPHLASVATWVVEAAAARQGDGVDGFMIDLIEALDQALENIDPEDFAAHESMALLVARPIAVVRARINFEIDGLPALHQGPEELRVRVSGDEPAADQWPDVSIPIRIGEHQQLNDGVVGFWAEDERGELAERFVLSNSQHTPLQRRGTAAAAPGASGRDDSATNHLVQALSDAPRCITMLMDPRGSAHCTSGVLPTKELTIPRKYVTQALETIRVYFLVAPVITPAARVEMPLPSLEGKSWTWLNRSGTGWRELDRRPVVQGDDIRGSFPNGVGVLESGEEVWETLLSQGWLASDAAGQGLAIVQPVRARKELKKDGAVLKDEAREIGRVIEMKTRSLTPAPLDARFPGQYELLEGWIRLDPERSDVGDGPTRAVREASVGLLGVMDAQYLVERDGSGQYSFRLRLDGQQILESTTRFESSSEVHAAIKEVRDSAMHPERFVELVSSQSEHYFVLRSRNATNLGRSPNYHLVQLMKASLLAVRLTAHAARIGGDL